MPTDPFSGLQIDLSNKAVQELLTVLETLLPFREDVLVIVREAKVPLGKINFSLPPRQLWLSVLDNAHRQKPSLVDAVLAQVCKTEPGAEDRILNLRSPSPVLSAPEGPPGGGSKKDWRGGEELILGAQSTLLDMEFLGRAIETASAVCRLQVEFPTLGPAWGTGFLIAPDLVLTNHHVLFGEMRDEERAVAARADFFYETGKQRVTVHGRVDSIERHDTLDCAILRLDTAITGVRPLRLEGERVPRKGDPAFIIQHPGGGPKQVGLYRNEIKLVDDEVVQYLTDTEPGSSGSPVCNREWDVVAIHHRSIEQVEAPVAGGAKVIVQRNQGVRVRPIVKWLTDLGIPLGARDKT